MFKDIKIKIIALLIGLICILYLLMAMRYKSVSKENTELEKQMLTSYQASEYVQNSFQLIRNSAVYQQDSLWLDPKRQLHSTNAALDSSIQRLYATPEKWDTIYAQVIHQKLPEYFVIYKEASLTLTK